MALAIAPAAPAVEEPAAVPDDSIWRLSLKKYHAMIDAGILTEDDPVELLEGWLVYKMTRNGAHSVALRRVRLAVERIVVAGWYVEAQDAITLANSEPEPDIMVARGEIEDYLPGHPGAEDVALVVEVSDTTLHRDQGTKKRVYARAGLSVYWIVNLPERKIEVYSVPSGSPNVPDYQQRQDYGPADMIPVMIAGEEVGRLAVGELLPPE